MADTAAVSKQSAAGAGGNTNPNLSVVPEPKSRQRFPSALNQRQVHEVELARSLCIAAKKAAYAPALAQLEISPQFITDLESDIKEAVEQSFRAVQCTTAKEALTVGEQTAKETLVRSLRDVQQAAKVKFQHTEPARLQDYLIGERIAANQATLDQSAQGIMSRANADRPPGVDTTVIVRVETEREAYVQSNAQQVSEQGNAKAQRNFRDVQVNSIKTRRQKIQLAAEKAWPWHKDMSAQARTEFRLPKGRPYHL